VGLKTRPAYPVPRTKGADRPGLPPREGKGQVNHSDRCNVAKTRKTAKGLYTRKALRAFNILRQTQRTMLAAWADALVELKLRQVPVEMEAQFRTYSRKKGLHPQVREEQKALADYWREVCGMTLQDRAKHFDEDGEDAVHYFLDIGEDWDRTDLEHQLADAVVESLWRFATGKRFPMNG
jgi:hypothetical protein